MAAAFGHVVNIQKGEADELTKSALKISTIRRKKVMLDIALLSEYNYIESYTFFCCCFSVTLPCLEKLVHFLINHTKSSITEPWKILQDVVLRMIELRRAGTAEQTKVR